MRFNLFKCLSVDDTIRLAIWITPLNRAPEHTHFTIIETFSLFPPSAVIDYRSINVLLFQCRNTDHGLSSHRKLARVLSVQESCFGLCLDFTPVWHLMLLTCSYFILFLKLPARLSSALTTEWKWNKAISHSFISLFFWSVIDLISWQRHDFGPYHLF